MELLDPFNRLTMRLAIVIVLLLMSQNVFADAMSTLSKRVAATVDDAQESSSGTATTSSTGLDIGSQAWLGIRFQNITIPKGATITKATLTIRSNSAYSATPAGATLFAQAADNAAAFSTSRNNISSRSRTSASVAFSPLPSFSANVDMTSTDISTLIQEVVDRSGWASGNALALIVRSDYASQRSFYSYDGSTTAAPLLYIEYTPFSRPAAPNLLFVCTSTTAPTAQELKREEWLKWWAYKVTRIAATDTQTNFNAAAAVNDVAYVSETITSTDVNTKLLNTAIGVVTDEPALLDDFQISSAQANTGANSFSVTTTGHTITSSLVAGTTACFSQSETSLEPAGTMAKEAVCLGSFFGGAKGLVTIEAGALLANGTNAAGRRVALPWAASIDFNYLTSSGQTILRMSLLWAAGLEARWKLDETSGTSASDSGPNGYTGTVGGTTPTWASGKLSNAITLSGTNYVQASGLAGSPKNVTVSAWAKLTTKDSGGSELISLGDAIAIRLDNGTTSGAFFYNGSTWSYASLSTTYLNSGWHHFAATFDDTNDLFTFYVDGYAKASQSTTASISYSGLGANIQIGRHGNGQTTYDFGGQIDEVRIYNHALTASEVLNLKKLNLPQGVRIIKWVEKQ